MIGIQNQEIDENEIEVQDFRSELKYSLWTDLSGEQTEFLDAFDHLQYYHLIKVNIFNLFDYSTVAHEMVQT